MITIVLFVFFIFLSGYLAFRRPTYFVVYYLLVSTKMLGFFDVEEAFVIGGLGLGFFSLNIITLIVSLLNKRTRKLDIRSKRFVVLFCGFLFFGIVYPYLQKNSSVLASFMASKELWSIAFFIYLIKHAHSIKIDRIFKAILTLGIYLSLVYSIDILLNIAPPFYLELKEGIGLYVRVYYPTYISIAVFVALYFRYSGIPFFINHYLTIIILFVGILLAGHTALFAGTLFSYVFFLLVKNYRKNFEAFLFKIALATILLIVLGFAFSNKIEDINNAIIKDSDISLVSRERYNQFRWVAIEEQPFFGYGFLNQTNQSKQDNDNIYMQRLGVIDSGYIDLLVKFGYVGMIFYLINWFNIIILPFLKMQHYGNLGLAMGCYLLQYLMVNHTWSVFTYSHGLIPGFFALFIILKKKRYITERK
jgi:hypothetical protein